MLAYASYMDTQRRIFKQAVFGSGLPAFLPLRVTRQPAKCFPGRPDAETPRGRVGCVKEARLPYRTVQTRANWNCHQTGWFFFLEFYLLAAQGAPMVQKWTDGPTCCLSTYACMDHPYVEKAGRQVTGGGLN